ncbi:CinA family protein [Arthrobacter sp. ATA002]|uniref:CinA family protein n=1 Tax=Arthrobacter sp. ATA002 TaxID=2991715 RepID=UPI0022A67CEA|nr:CinA family protein [Arthrobacter sp. ATA002]WAP51019.1 CinA family protein [Arthrobacter sp. ATA002]
MTFAGSGGAQEVVSAAAAAGLTVATAESLTAGLVAAELGAVPGASAVLLGGVVAYANTVKKNVLGVDGGLLAAAGSVDAEVARQMACGARRVLAADIGVATTGAAGPEPHDGKPVGCVFIAVAAPEQTLVREFSFSGDRAAIRRQACDEALVLLAGVLADRA